ncbi:hypothetical protein HOH45_02125 [bacterium]|nr:hypothetical protein [bacterium]
MTEHGSWFQNWTTVDEPLTATIKKDVKFQNETNKLVLKDPNGSSVTFSPSGQNLLISAGGNVGIGVLTPEHKLHVAGTVKADNFLVKNSEWADYVFEPDYPLMSLDKLDHFVGTKKHLPNIPSQKELAKKGLNLGDMQKLQMEKIEEAHLYIIELNKQLNEQKQRIDEQEKINRQQSKDIILLKKQILSH